MPKRKLFALISFFSLMTLLIIAGIILTTIGHINNQTANFGVGIGLLVVGLGFLGIMSSYQISKFYLRNKYEREIQEQFLKEQIIEKEMLYNKMTLTDPVEPVSKTKTATEPLELTEAIEPVEQIELIQSIEQVEITEPIELVDETTYVPSVTTNLYPWQEIDYKYYYWSDKPIIITNYLLVYQKDLPVYLRDYVVAIDHHNNEYSYHFEDVAAFLDTAVNLNDIFSQNYLLQSSLKPIFLKVGWQPVGFNNIQNTINYRHNHFGIPLNLIKQTDGLVKKTKPIAPKLNKIKVQTKFQFMNFNKKVMKMPNTPITYKVKKELNQHNL